MARSTRPDLETLGLARSGDGQALEAVLTRLADELLPLASALTAASGEADVLLGDALSRVYERLHQLERPEALLPWARRVMVRQFLDHRRWRVRRREVRLETIALPSSTKALSADVLDLQREMATLSNQERTLLVLRFWHGYTYEECADLVDLPVGTVKSRLSRLLSKLRIALGGDHDDAV